MLRNRAISEDEHRWQIALAAQMRSANLNSLPIHRRADRTCPRAARGASLRQSTTATSLRPRQSSPDAEQYPDCWRMDVTKTSRLQIAAPAIMQRSLQVLP